MRASDVAVGLVLVVAGGLQWFYLHEEAATRAPMPAPVLGAEKAPPAVVAAGPPRAPVPEPVAPTPPAEAPTPTHGPLLGESWMAETVDGILAQHQELNLTAEEVAGLKDVYAYCQNVRTSYEADIAQIVSLNDNRARIRIPAYPVAGARLQQMFHEELKAELGEQTYGDVDDYLGNTFEVAFKWFGASVQELDVELKRDPAAGLLYRIVARMDFADTVEPELGQNETRLFSTTAHYVLKPETVATGEWRPLARHFPRLPDVGASVR